MRISCMAVFLTTLGAGAAEAAIPLQVNYQGRVAVSGQPFNGNGQFRFTLANADTSLTIWCNDGSQVGLPASTTPTAAVNLPVINGIFNVRLGDTIHPNMIALPSTVFDSDRVVLRTWFDDGTHGNALLSPDQPITSVAYAFHAAKADIVTPWEEVTTDTQAVPNHGYVTDNASTLVTITLPTSASLAIGDTIRVSGAGIGGWKMAQNAGQKIRFLDYSRPWIPHESSQNWIDVASSADGTKLVACVEGGGQIYTSSNSGVTWTARESNRNWHSVASSADGTKLVACVQSGGQIYTSSDSGVTWTARESARDWEEVASSADGTKLVACTESGGQLYTSTDSGVSWTARESNRTWRCVASSADGTKLVAVVYGGQIYTSPDSGVTWTARESNRNWISVASSADGTKPVACVENGQLYTSLDSGQTWTARESNRAWRAVASSQDGTRVAACVYFGQIYTSLDSGVTWTARGSNRDWRGCVAMSADGTKLVAGSYGGQIYTCNAGGTVAGTGGWLSGGKDSAVELQYIGDNTFIVLSHEGSLGAN